MIRLLRLRHAAAGYRLGAVRAQSGATRVLEHQAGRGPWKLPPSWGLATAQVSSVLCQLGVFYRDVEARSKPRLAYGRVERREQQSISSTRLCTL
jgi:hypothetical protein